MINLVYMIGSIIIFSVLGGYLVHHFSTKSYLYGLGFALLVFAFIILLLLILAYLDY